jgi:hypothetical protein
MRGTVLEDVLVVVLCALYSGSWQSGASMCCPNYPEIVLICFMQHLTLSSCCLLAQVRKRRCMQQRAVCSTRLGLPALLYWQLFVCLGMHSDVCWWSWQHLQLVRRPGTLQLLNSRCLSLCRETVNGVLCWNDVLV